MYKGHGSDWTLALLKERVRKRWSRHSGTMQSKAALERRGNRSFVSTTVQREVYCDYKVIQWAFLEEQKGSSTRVSAEGSQEECSLCLSSSSNSSDLRVSLHLVLFSLHLFSILLAPILPATIALQVGFKQYVIQIPFVPLQPDLSGQQNKHN